MASTQQVRQYLAYWFQLGKGVVVQGRREPLLPRPVIQGNSYSPAFEAIWEEIMAAKADTCYLQGTAQSIAELLTSAWEINPCARCSMPVPLHSPEWPPVLECPCADLPDWPNPDLPSPHDPVDTTNQLLQIRDRLRQSANHPDHN